MIHIDKVYKCILDAKSGKAPGFDEIPNELLKNYVALVMLHRLFNRCYIIGKVPYVWSIGIIFRVPKS